MAKYSFNDEEDLGKTIEQAQPFCSLSPKSQIRGISQVTGDLAGHKFSKLCGFIFKSKAPGAYNTFLVVYCPKLRGNFIRNDRGLSGWYCWKHIGFQNEMVMSRQDMLNVFGFNVDKFFQSDMFEKWLPKFQAQVQASLDTVVKDFIGKLESSQKKEVEFYVNAVKASLEKIGDVVKAGEDGSQHAKLAYNADFNYSLKEKEQEADESVMDYPKEEGLCRDVWEERLTLDGTGVEYALADEAEWKVQSLVEFIQERAGVELTRVHITGSITSNSWTKSSDIDIHFLGPDLSDEDAEQLNKRIRELYEDVYKAESPEMCDIGGHPLEVYFQANEFQDLMSVGCYDFTSREWLVGPELKDSSFSPWSEYYKEVQEKSESILSQVRDIVMMAYEKAVVCLKALKGQDKSFWEEQSQEMERLLEKGSKLFDSIRAMRKAYSSPQSAEQALEWRSSRKWKIADASFKLMDKYGYTAILKQMKQSLEKMRASQEIGEKMFSLEMVVQAVRSSLGSPEKLADSEQGDRVYEKDEGFGGDCGVFALKLAKEKVKEGHSVQVVFCANVPFEKIGDLLDEGTLYHVAVMLDSSLDEIYDASGKVSVQSLKDFCRDEYRDPEPDIWAVEYKADGSDDDKKIEKVIRNATAWSEWPSELNEDGESKSKIWVDDVRKAPFGYTAIKSVDDFIKWLDQNGSEKIEVLDLDHDAGDFQSQGGDYIKILDYLEFIGAKDLRVRIHSDNPVGRQNMQRIIRKNGWEEVHEILNESASSMRKEVEMLFESHEKSTNEYGEEQVYLNEEDPEYREFSDIVKQCKTKSFFKSEDGIETDMSPLKLDSLAKVNGKHYVAAVYGGENGSGRFQQYLDTVKKLVELTSQKFSHPWLIDWKNDCADDVWDLRIGFRDKKHYKITGAILGCLGDDAELVNYKITEQLDGDPWIAIIESDGDVTKEELDLWHELHVKDVDRKGVPYYFIVTDREDDSTYVWYSDDDAMMPIDTIEQQLIATDAGLAKGLAKDQLDFSDDEDVLNESKKDESTAKMSQDEYAKDLIHKMGADPNYTPRHTRQSMMDSLAHEYILQMPTDTAAVEKEFDAALLLVKSGDDEAVKLGKKLGDAIVHGTKRERLLELMRKAYLAFLDMPHDVDESAEEPSDTPQYDRVFNEIVKMICQSNCSKLGAKDKLNRGNKCILLWYGDVKKDQYGFDDYSCCDKAWDPSQSWGIAEVQTFPKHEDLTEQQADAAIEKARAFISKHSSQQVDEGIKQTISIGMLASLLAIPGILPAKTIQKTIDKNQRYEMIVKDINNNIRMIGDYTAFQAANIIARTLYAEARNDGEKGMNAVASVIFNRAKGNVDDFVNVCKKHGYSKKYKKIVYQFSCWGKMSDAEWSPKDFKIKIPSSVNGNKNNEALWKAAMQIAADMLAGSFKPTTDANMYYNDKTAHPDWGNQLTSVKYIGSHKFGILKNHSAFV